MELPGGWRSIWATASYDRTNNVEFWGIYTLPFGYGQRYLNHGLMSEIVGGFQLNGQYSHISGAPFSVGTSSNNLNAPGNPSMRTRFSVVSPTGWTQPHGRQSSGERRQALVRSGWRSPRRMILLAASRAIQAARIRMGSPRASAAFPVLGNTSRDEFRGPGTDLVNASLFRGFHVYRESEFQIRFEAFNVLNHPQLSTPNATQGTSNFGYITSFNATRSLQFSGRFNF